MDSPPDPTNSLLGSVWQRQSDDSANEDGALTRALPPGPAVTRRPSPPLPAASPRPSPGPSPGQSRPLQSHSPQGGAACPADCIEGADALLRTCCVGLKQPRAPAWKGTAGIAGWAGAATAAAAPGDDTLRSTRSGSSRNRRSICRSNHQLDHYGVSSRCGGNRGAGGQRRAGSGSCRRRSSVHRLQTSHGYDCASSRRVGGKPRIAYVDPWSCSGTYGHGSARSHWIDGSRLTTSGGRCAGLFSSGAAKFWIRKRKSPYKGPTSRAAIVRIMERLKVDKGEMPAFNSGASKTSPRHRRITFARLATCILNVERVFKRHSRAREEELLQASENGDVGRLRELVAQARGDVNLECTDQLGRTPLHLAVVNEHKEVMYELATILGCDRIREITISLKKFLFAVEDMMDIDNVENQNAVKILLDFVEKRRVYQALLSAINLGNEEIAEIIIEHPKYDEISREIKEHGRAYFDFSKFYDENQFSEEITPLILASQQNRFEVVMALLLKGELIDKPHHCNCACAECATMTRTDELKFARSRLNAFRALASAAYISLSSDDPILTCFELRKELQQVATEEKYYATEYNALSSSLSDYVVRLLDKVHGNEELNAILNASTHGLFEASEDLPRLQLAITYKEKKFVAHPSCQKKLSTLWCRGIKKMMLHRSGLLQTLALLTVILLYPLFAIIFIIAPNSKIGCVVRTPCIKFMAQAFSYLVFLGLILVHGYVEQGKLCTHRIQDLIAHPNTTMQPGHHLINASYAFLHYGRTCIRSHNPAVLELLIVVWISGMVWQASHQIFAMGLRAHFTDVYNALDFFMLKFYIASLTLRRVIDTEIRLSLDFFKEAQSWEGLGLGQPRARYHMYWINADRFYWDAWDPGHMYEALFSVGNILNFTRLFHLLALSEHLGPMLISLERMSKDVMKFMVTFVTIFLAFMFGMYNLYWYYDPTVRKKAEIIDHKIVTKAEQEFGNLEYTFRSIYWAVFGLKDPRNVELGEAFNGRFTERVGYIVFGFYNFVAVIVLFNVLIAMMTRSFDKIATDQDIEWKFVRSKLYMEYIKQGSTLPVPLNLIPTPGAVRHLLKSLLPHRHTQYRPPDGPRPPGEDGEDATFMSMNGGSRLLPHKGRAGEGAVPAEGGAAAPVGEAADGARGSMRHGRREGRAGKRRRSSFAKRLIHSMDLRHLPSDVEDGDEYRMVIKRVVRRYIFEHLLASVTPNEGMEIDTIRSQNNSIQSEVHRVSLSVEEQNARLHESLSAVSGTIGDMRQQLDQVTQMCCTLLRRRGSSRGRHASPYPSSDDSDAADGGGAHGSSGICSPRGVDDEIASTIMTSLPKTSIRPPNNNIDDAVSPAPPSYATLPSSRSVPSVTSSRTTPVGARSMKDVIASVLKSHSQERLLDYPTGAKYDHETKL